MDDYGIYRGKLSNKQWDDTKKTFGIMNKKAIRTTDHPKVFRLIWLLVEAEKILKAMKKLRMREDNIWKRNSIGVNLKIGPCWSRYISANRLHGIDPIALAQWGATNGVKKREGTLIGQKKMRDDYLDLAHVLNKN